MPSKDVDIFVFGHRHIPYIIDLKEKAICANIGDWLINFTFLVFDENQIEQKTYRNGTIENYSTDLEKVYQLKLF